MNVENGFLDNPAETLPPPPDHSTRDLSAAPAFTPFTVAPSILNKDEVVRAMEREYPASLRDAGLGGTVTVYFFIDEAGAVQDRRVDRSSGYAGLGIIPDHVPGEIVGAGTAAGLRSLA